MYRESEREDNFAGHKIGERQSSYDIQIIKTGKMQTNHIAKGLFCEGEVAPKGATGCGWPPLEKPGHADPPAMGNVVG